MMVCFNDDALFQIHKIIDKKPPCLDGGRL